MDTKNSNTTKKVITIILTLLILFAVVGFLYPWLTQAPVRIANVPTDAETQSPEQQPPEASVITSTDLTATPPVDDPPLKPPVPTVTVDSGPVYYGISTADLEDTSAWPESTQLYEAIRALGNTSQQSTRTVPVTSFTAPGHGYYVYFAWPTAYEEHGTFSCKSITHLGVPLGTIDCFTSGSSLSNRFNTTDMLHRTIADYVNDKGEGVSYELYRAHYFITPNGTVYYSSD